MNKVVLVISLFLFSAISFAGPTVGYDTMEQAKMEKIVKAMAQHSTGEGGVVEFQFNNVRMFLLSDIAHNRMRIIAPIAEYAKLSSEQITAALESNFHKALDARYAISNDVLYSAYIHPLAELTDAQIKTAVQQVANLAISFGGEYTSGVLNYNPQ